MKYRYLLWMFVSQLFFASTITAQEDNHVLLKEEVVKKVDERAKLAQVMVDKIFSFSELGFQEIETSKYITDILKENGFTIEYGISGVPTAWMARWGSGHPVIAIEAI